MNPGAARLRSSARPVALAVAVLGALISLMGLAIVVWPRSWEPPLRRVTANGVVWVALVRLAFGAFLIAASSACRWPVFVAVIGAVSAASGVAVLLMGRRRFLAVVDFFSELPPGALRLWGAVAAAFGLLVVRGAV